MLRVLSDNTLDSINKNLKFAQTFMKEGFEFFSSDKNIGLIVYLTLILLPAKKCNDL